MKKSSPAYYLILVCALLGACSSLKETYLATPSAKPKPSATVTMVPIVLIPTELPSNTPTLAPTPFPTYPTKQVLLEYVVTGDHSLFDIYYVDGLSTESNLILYSDGQLIISGKKYEQKILSDHEITQLLSKLESLGFYTLQSNQKYDPTDKLYNFGSDQYESSFDGLYDCVVLNGARPRTLCVYESLKQYLVPGMKNILHFLDNYRPAGLSPYYPDRMFLWIQEGRDPNNDNLPKEAIPWPASLPAPDTSNYGMTFVDGIAAKTIYSLFANVNSEQVFTYNGIEYTVLIQIVLPHEEITNVYR